LRLFSFGGYGLALAALALVVFGAIECPPTICSQYFHFPHSKKYRLSLKISIVQITKIVSRTYFFVLVSSSVKILITSGRFCPVYSSAEFFVLTPINVDIIAKIMQL